MLAAVYHLWSFYAILCLCGHLIWEHFTSLCYMCLCGRFAYFCGCLFWMVLFLFLFEDSLCLLWSFCVFFVISSFFAVVRILVPLWGHFAALYRRFLVILHLFVVVLFWLFCFPLQYFCRLRPEPNWALRPLGLCLVGSFSNPSMPILVLNSGKHKLATLEEFCHFQQTERVFKRAQIYYYLFLLTASASKFCNILIYCNFIISNTWKAGWSGMDWFQVTCYYCQNVHSVVSQ